MDHRSFLRVSAAGAATIAGAAALGAGWATLVEPNRPVVEQIDGPLPRLPARLDGLRLAQLSDLHISQYTTAGDIAPPVRLNCPPEVTVLTLRAM